MIDNAARGAIGEKTIETMVNLYVMFGANSQKKVQEV